MSVVIASIAGTDKIKGHRDDQIGYAVCVNVRRPYSSYGVYLEGGGV